MIPVRLTVEGLYSYQTRQTIDFTKLTQSPLFGIFGAVGSGKSSILDAITFALYGKVERLGASGDNRNYNMMNLQANKLFIEFIFRTSTTTNGVEDTTEYKFVVQGKRDSKKFSEVKAPERKAYKRSQPNEAWQVLGTTTADHILGLSYDNFRRTMIIPQGKFQEFLQLTSAERSTMLQTMFRLERFNLADGVKSLTQANNVALAAVQSRLHTLGDVSEDVLERKRAEADELRSVLASVQAEAEQAAVQAQELAELKTRAAEAEAAKQALERLTAQEAAFAARRALLQEVETAQELFAARLKQRTTLQAAIEQGRKEFVKHQRAVEDAQKALAAAQAVYERSKTALLQRETLKQRAHDMQTLVEMRGIAEKLQELAERLHKGETLLAKRHQDRAEAERTEQQLATRLATAKAQMPDRSLLAAVQQWCMLDQTIAAEIRNLQQHTRTRTQDLATAVEQLAAVVVPFTVDLAQFSDLEAVFHVPARQELTMPEGIQTWLDALHSEIRRLLDGTIEEIHRAEAHAEALRNAHQTFHAHLQQLAAALVEGEPCPLCGAVHHPKPYTASTLDIPPAAVSVQASEQSSAEASATLTALKRRHKALQELFKTVGQRQRECTRLAAVIVAQSAELERAKQQLAEAERRHADHQATFQHERWHGFSPEQPALETALKATTQAADALEAEIRSLENDREKNDAIRVAAAKDVEQYQQRLHTLVAERSKYEATHHTLRDNLETVNGDEYALYETKTLGEMEAERATAVQRAANIEHEHATAERVLNETINASTTARLRAEQAKTALAKDEASAETLDRELTELCHAKGYATLAEIEALLAQSMNTAAERAALEHFDKALHAARTNAEASERALQGRMYDAHAHNALVKRLAELRSLQHAHTQRLGAVEQELTTLTERLAARQQALVEQQRLQARERNLKILEKLFRGGGFVRYVSRVYLEQLTAAANVRFQELTGRHLALHLDDEGGFQVRDYMNGGECRSIKTLSGGQMFQASFSLALALADSVQQVARANQRFFFLDEGFGTLDSNALRLVLSALKALRSEQRIVGVISHVEALQQEISVYVSVENTIERGSIITPSWEKA